nr:M56 family metallopeptidase [Nocardioides perillae]
MLRRARARQRSAVTLVADHDERADVWLLEEPRPAAYVLPGRVPMIVVTTGAVADLHDGELRAVLAHERAHVDGRHDIAITVARILHRALPGVPLLAAAAREVPRLLEMHADDRAAQAHGRRALATALARLAGALRPGTEATPVTLRSTGGDAAARVERMTDAARRGRCWQRCALGAVALVLLLAPLALAAAPAVEAAVLDYCPVPLG